MGRDTERCTFSTSVSGLPPGKTTLTLFCPVSSLGSINYRSLTVLVQAVAAGLYLLDSSELRMAKLYLRWQHKKPSSKAFPSRKETKVLVRVPKDLLALDVNISQPERSKFVFSSVFFWTADDCEVELGEPPTILVAVSTGRNHVVKAFVKLSSSGVTFLPKDAYYNGGGDLLLEHSAISLTI